MLFEFVFICEQVRYSVKGYHSMPVYINVLNNAILRANLPAGKGDPSAYGVYMYIIVAYNFILKV